MQPIYNVILYSYKTKIFNHCKRNIFTHLQSSPILPRRHMHMQENQCRHLSAKSVKLGKYHRLREIWYFHRSRFLEKSSIFYVEMCNEGGWRGRGGGGRVAKWLICFFVVTKDLWLYLTSITKAHIGINDLLRSHK